MKGPSTAVWVGTVSAVAVTTALVVTWSAPWLSPVLLGLIAAAVVVCTALLLRGIARLTEKPSRGIDDLIVDLVRKTGPRWRDALPCYLTIQDRELRIIEANDRFLRDFDFSVGDHCFSAYKGRDEPCPDCPVLKTFDDGQQHSSPQVVVNKAGESSTIVATSVPLRDRHDELVAVMEMSASHDETRELQRELDRSRQDFKRLFDAVPCYITVQDRDFSIVESNELFRRDFGDNGSARTCFAAYKGRDDVCPECPVQKSFADGEIHSTEETVTTGDGRQVNLIVYSMPIRDERGEVGAVMEVSTNITEVKRLQHQLAMMGLAVAGMAHRIKNILMGLEGGIFLVNSGFEEDNRYDVEIGWEMVQRNVGKVSTIVKDLLFCAKDREAQLEDDVDVGAVLGEVHALYRSRAEEQQIAFELDAAPVRGRFDREALHNLLSNLVANAIDACRFDTESGDKDYWIKLSARRGRGGTTVIEVADNGAGIPAHIHDKVFRGFFSTKGTEGTGLGLLVAQKIVEEHGGTITFASTEGKGTRFTIRFPPAADRRSRRDDRGREDQAAI